jgi:hypothetical protein
MATHLVARGDGWQILGLRTQGQAKFEKERQPGKMPNNIEANKCTNVNRGGV